jgi:HEPN domain-containing protein
VDKVNYWLDLSKEDLTVARLLIDGGKYLYAGFLTHLAVEKALKAQIESNGDTPQKIHNLIRLAELGGLLALMNDKQTELLKMLNPLQIEARYPAYKQAVESTLTAQECDTLLEQAKEMITWIEQRL